MSIKIERTALVCDWPNTIYGARSAMESYDQSDSWFLTDCSEGCYYYEELIPKSDYYDHCSDDEEDKEEFLKRKEKAGNYIKFLIGPKDHKLLMNLAKASTSESKWRRFVNVSMVVTAPLYWWKEFETYKVGTVSNSCSTMHKIHAKEFTLDDFSHDNLFNRYGDPSMNLNYGQKHPLDHLRDTISVLNKFREEFIFTKDKRYWWQMIQLLPSSYNQRRTIQLNYEVLAKQYKERKEHKLDEWREYCKWIETLPYSEFITLNDD